jgi:DNA glycosylase AlkZ-like
MPTVIADHELRRARVAAQLLHRPSRRPAIADLVARLLAVQAQDIAASPLALRARARDLTADDLTAAREDRSVVRAWGPRGTLHLVAATDLAWLTTLTRPSVAGSMRRLTQEGVTGSESALIRTVDRALEGQGPLSKVELGERLNELKVPAHGQGIVHMAALGAAYGLVVLGPDRDGKPTYVHTGDWLGRPIALDHDPAAAGTELARRYLKAHGPADPADLAAWSGRPLTGCRAAFASIADELIELRHHDRPLWRLTRGSPRAVDVPARLLPAFDEYLLGWRDRSLIVDDTYAQRVGPGGGILKPTVIADGRIVGTWRTGPVPELFDACDEAALAAEVEDVRRFRPQA